MAAHAVDDVFLETLLELELCAAAHDPDDGQSQ